MFVFIWLTRVSCSSVGQTAIHQLKGQWFGTRFGQHVEVSLMSGYYLVLGPLHAKNPLPVYISNPAPKRTKHRLFLLHYREAFHFCTTQFIFLLTHYSLTTDRISLSFSSLLHVSINILVFSSSICWNFLPSPFPFVGFSFSLVQFSTH